MKLVDDWRKWWKWLSTWLIASNATFIVAYEQFETVKAYVPDKVAHWVVVSLLVLTALGRIVKQTGGDDAGKT
jgi:hypothetical protein